MGYQTRLAALMGLFFILTFGITGSVQAKPLQSGQGMQILVPVYPPYTYKTREHWQGVAYDAAISVLENADLDYQLIPVANYATAFEKLKQHQADAVLIASQNSQRNEYASFTLPIFCVNWYWYLHPQTSQHPTEAGFKLSAKVASAYGSNHYFWLTQNKFSVAGVLKLDNIAKMLAARRVDAVLASKLVFEETARKAAIDPARFRQIHHSYQPSGMYIDKAFIKQSPDIMAKINRQIRLLAPSKQCINRLAAR